MPHPRDIGRAIDTAVAMLRSDPGRLAEIERTARAYFTACGYDGLGLLPPQRSNTMIQPTPGRVVWYHPAADEPVARFRSQPLAAMIAGVWSDTCVNLVVFDANGNPHSRTSVLLYQGDTDRPSARFCEWMPYQKGQAAKTEQLERQVADTSERVVLSDSSQATVVRSEGGSQ